MIQPIQTVQRTDPEEGVSPVRGSTKVPRLDQFEGAVEATLNRDNCHRYWLAFDNMQTVAIEPLLRKLPMPVLVAWALDDVFFELKWGHWLRTRIPGVVRVVEVPDAKLFFPEDRPHALVAPLRSFLSGGQGARVVTNREWTATSLLHSRRTEVAEALRGTANTRRADSEHATRATLTNSLLEFQSKASR